MQDHDKTHPLTLSEAAAAVPKLKGKHLHISTLWRWCRRGCKGRNGTIVRLAHARIGGTIVTTRGDMDRFFNDLAEADLESFRADDAMPVVTSLPPAPTPSGLRKAQLAHADRVLAKAGI